MVNKFASNIGATISSSTRTVGVAGELNEFTFTSSSARYDPTGGTPIVGTPEWTPSETTSTTKVQIFIIYTGPSYGDTTNLQATAAANGGSFLTPTTTTELVDALFKIIALPSNSLPTVTSTVTLTAISEDSKAITETSA